MMLPAVTPRTMDQTQTRCSANGREGVQSPHMPSLESCLSEPAFGGDQWSAAGGEKAGKFCSSDGSVFYLLKMGPEKKPPPGGDLLKKTIVMDTHRKKTHKEITSHRKTHMERIPSKQKPGKSPHGNIQFFLITCLKFVFPLNAH